MNVPRFDWFFGKSAGNLGNLMLPLFEKSAGNLGAGNLGNHCKSSDADHVVR